jgi:type I restriction-modification system DNA methylase subunit
MIKHMRTLKIELIQTWIEEIIYRIDCKKQALENKDLLQICGGIEKIMGGEFNPHFCHEIAETALNLLILTKYAEDLAGNPVDFVRQNLKPLLSRIRAQTWRSREQISFQQFSTPPAIGFLLAHTLNIKPGEIVLEPSAGTGSLAVWAKMSGAKVLTNEIDARRRELLQQLGFEPTAFNAEFIHDYLAPDLTVDVLLMNPPFSANGGRTRNSSKYGFRHVCSALERLGKGGRFGIILGKSGGPDTKTGREFWQKMVERFHIQADIKLNGREYYKFGTTVDINLIFGEKLVEPRRVDSAEAVNQIPFFTARTVEEAFDQAATQNLRSNR